MNLLKRRTKVPADELAQSLLTEFINSDVIPKLDLPLDEVQEARYQTQTQWYRLAVVILSLRAEEQKDAKYFKVRDNLERLVFKEPSLEGLALLEEVKQAMQSMNVLFDPRQRGREMSWAREWLATIGVAEFNPVRLTLVAKMWMDFYVTAVRMLREFEPL